MGLGAWTCACNHSHQTIFFPEEKIMDVTMHDFYGDGSDHDCCERCGFCISCEDCADYGCGSPPETSSDEPMELKHAKSED